MESELINRQLHKLMQSSTADTCNKLSVGISWKLSRESISARPNDD